MNIATYIAYLIGDSLRKTIPKYEIGIVPVTLKTGPNEVLYTAPTMNINDINHPVGVISIEHIDTHLTSTYNINTGWRGDLNTLIMGETYIIVYSPPQSIPEIDAIAIQPLADKNSIKTDAYGLQDLVSELQYHADMVPYYILNNWVRESLITVSKLVPSKYRFHMIASKDFSAREWEAWGHKRDEPGQEKAKGIDLSSLESNEIVAVMRYDGLTAYECRQIPNHMRDKAKFDSGFLEECSETDPVYYVSDMNRIIVMPEPNETGVQSMDGFCQVDYVHYPQIDVNEETIVGSPVDVQNVILLSTAIKCKKFEIQGINVPNKLIVKLSDEYAAIALDRPNVMDAIEKAQNLIDDFGGGSDYIDGNSFLDFIKNEDIEMGLTALKGAAAELEIARTDLSEQEKRGAQYLSQYSQDISKFSQNISAFMGRYKKNYADLDNLKADYQQSIYAMRGQLPNKKQLGENEKKISQIKQVVDKGI